MRARPLGTHQYLLVLPLLRSQRDTGVRKLPLKSYRSARVGPADVRQVSFDGFHHLLCSVTPLGGEYQVMYARTDVHAMRLGNARLSAVGRYIP